MLIGAGLLATLALIGGSLAFNDVSKDEPAASSQGGSNNPGTSAGGGQNPVTNGTGSEVIRQPKESDSRKRRSRSAKIPSTTTALVGRPLPKTASRAKGIVAGFPVKVIAVSPTASVGSSGVSTAGRRLQVSLVGKDKLSQAKLLGFYRRTLTAKGFAESQVTAVGGSSAAAFARGADHLVVTVKARPKGAKGSVFSVFGTLHAAKGK